jgi:hypothetical protein
MIELNTHKPAGQAQNPIFEPYTLETDGTTPPTANRRGARLHQVAPPGRGVWLVCTSLHGLEPPTAGSHEPRQSSHTIGSICPADPR